MFRHLITPEAVNLCLPATISRRRIAAMSYGVHIKRSEAQGTHGITLEEWLAYVRSDKEMRLVGEANFTSSRAILFSGMRPA